MAGKINTSPARGTRDLLPEECALRDSAADVILRTYRSFGFQRIETPALEHIELLAGSQGGENEKLIYKILKRGEKLDLARAAEDVAALVDLGLRYDLTVPLARYYANNQGALPAPFIVAMSGLNTPRQKASDILQQVGLAERWSHYPAQLSGGEKQRVAIARAFATEPAVLFADEPTGNLDSRTGGHVIDLMFELNRDSSTTLVLVTHDKSLAARCDRIIGLDGGLLVSDEKAAA